MKITPGITVNGVVITPEEINAEVQFHPAGDLVSAKQEAMQALVVRELLIQRAVEVGLGNRKEIQEHADNFLDKLLEQEISVPKAKKTECERFYKANQERFLTSPLFEAAHILYPAALGNEKARSEAKAKAEKALQRIQEDPLSFDVIARTESACSSAKMDGCLGQITKGQTSPRFEEALLKMQEGEISTEPLETEYGFHLIKVHKRIDGEKLPFDIIKDWISEYLERETWQKAFQQYIQILSSKADISGFRMPKLDNPLVQ